MRGPKSGSSSPDIFSILGGIFHIIFGLFFSMVLMFPFLAIEWIIDDGLSGESILFLLGSLVIAAPFVAVTWFLVMYGFSMMTGWDPSPKRKKSRPGNPRTRSKANVVFGGHRSAIGAVFLFMITLPFLIASPALVIYGVMLFFSGQSGAEACFFIPLGIIFSWILYALMSNVLSKRTLKVDQNNGILFYQTTLFGRRVAKEIRPIVEVLEVKAWKSYTDGGLERDHLVIYGEGQKGRWSMDLSIMTQTNFIDPKKVARALGVPIRSKLEDNNAGLEKLGIDLDELIEQEAEDAKIKAEKDKKNKFFLGAAIFCYLLGFIMEGEAQGFLKIYFVAGTVCLILQYLVSIGKIGFGEGSSGAGGIDWGNDDYW